MTSEAMKTAYDLTMAFTNSKSLAVFIGEAAKVLSCSVEIKDINGVLRASSIIGEQGLVQLHQPVVNQNQVIAYIGTDKPLGNSEDHETLIQLVGKLAEKLMADRQSGPSDLETSFWKDLIEGVLTSSIHLKTRKEMISPHWPSQFQLLLVRTRTGQLPIEVIEILQTQIASSFNLHMNDGLIFILSGPFLKKTDPAWLELDVLLGDHGLVAMLSDPIRDELAIHTHLSSMQMVMSQMQTIYSLSNLALYNDFKVFRLILDAAGRPGFFVEDFVDNRIYSIYLNDQKSKSNYLYTLYCFVTSSSSYVNTAEKMNLHKNTVKYRIDKLLEQYDLNLELDEVKFNIFLSCNILRVLGLV